MWLPLRFFRRRGLTSSNICAIMIRQSLFRARCAPPLCGVRGQQEVRPLGGGLLFLAVRPRFFAYHSRSLRPADPRPASGFSRLSVRKLSTGQQPAAACEVFLLDKRQKAGPYSPAFPNFRGAKPGPTARNSRPNATKPLSFCCVRFIHRFVLLITRRSLSYRIYISHL